MKPGKVAARVTRYDFTALCACYNGAIKRTEAYRNTASLKLSPLLKRKDEGFVSSRFVLTFLTFKR